MSPRSSLTTKVLPSRICTSASLTPASAAASPCAADWRHPAGRAGRARQAALEHHQCRHAALAGQQAAQDGCLGVQPPGDDRLDVAAARSCTTASAGSSWRRHAHVAVVHRDMPVVDRSRRRTSKRSVADSRAKVSTQPASASSVKNLPTGSMICSCPVRVPANCRSFAAAPPDDSAQQRKQQVARRHRPRRVI